MSDDSSIELVEWHDGELDTVEFSSTTSVVKFAKSYVYRRQENDVYDIEQCGSRLTFAGVHDLKSTGTICKSRVSDCTIQTSGGDARVRELLRGTGPGRWELVLTNGAMLEGRFDNVKLELSGPYVRVETWEGPLTPESD